MKRAIWLAPFVPMMAMSDASADCTSTIENTSNSSRATLSANSNNTCLINSGTILPVPNVTLGSSYWSPPAIMVDGWPTGFSGVMITNNGSISSTRGGILVDSGSSVSQLTNNGSITVNSVAGSNLAVVGVALDYGVTWGIAGYTDGTKIYSSIASFHNYGIINVFGSGNGAAGFDNSGGTVSNLINDGTITAEDTGFGAAGIVNEAGQSISNLTNNSTISATNISGRAYGIYNEGLLTSLTNSASGTISGGTNGIFNESRGVINTFSNSGAVQSTSDHGIQNSGAIGTFTNNSTGTLIGAISGISNGGQFGTILNNGSITGEAVYGEGIGNGQTITTIINNGTINAANNGIGNDGVIDYIENNGTINVANKGTYSGQVFSSKGIYNGPDVPGLSGSLGGKINSILNTGTITVSAGGPTNEDAAILNAGTIGSITNSGTLRGFADGVYNDSTGRITTLTNQGTITSGSSSFGIRNQGTITTLNNVQNNLIYTGTLPANYNIIINSTSAFGRLVGTNVTGSAIFGLSNLSSWTPSNYTFTGVLSGLSTSNIASSSLTGNFGGYKWSLFLGNGSSTVWDLKFESTAIGAGSTSSLSSGSGGSPITVSGGTLEATSNSTITAPITLTGSSNSTINASGKSTVFSSAITSSGSGKLVLSDSTGSGAITLNSQNNVIAGGVAITSGTVAVGDGNNPNAKLQADVTLSPSSTLKGHGTIVGAIANNGGTVRPGGSIGTLAVSGSYDQSASSTLSIEINPSQNSQLSVYGTLGKANLGGTLDIVATPGTYVAKKYTMVTTTGGVVGSFSNITSNFSNYSNLYSAVSYDSQNAYFTIYGFTLADTQSSIVKTHGPKNSTTKLPISPSS